MTIKSGGQIILEEASQAIGALKGCVTPIFDVNDKHEAELLGSGVLIEVANGIFLCTAKHVIDGNAKSTLYIDGPSKLEILEGDFYGSGEHDISVLKLTTDQIEILKKYIPLRVDNIANQVQALACKYVQFIGFPATKNRKTYQRNEIEGLIQSNGCTVIEINSAKVRVNFNRKRNMDARSRQRVTAPDPHGMSGGAMFGISVNDATIKGKPEPLLIGISTDWTEKANEVSGTNVAIVMTILRDAYDISLPPRLNPTNIKT